MTLWSVRYAKSLTTYSTKPRQRPSRVDRVARDLADLGSWQPVSVAPRRHALLQRGPILVHIDARHDDVFVPPKLHGNASLVLRLGHGLKPPIHDLIVDDYGISATLTFGASTSRCVLPWNRIYATVLIGEQQGMIWPQDMPAEAAIAAHASHAACAPATTTIREAGNRAAHLKLVE